MELDMDMLHMDDSKLSLQVPETNLWINRHKIDPKKGVVQGEKGESRTK